MLGVPLKDRFAKTRRSRRRLKVSLFRVHVIFLNGVCKEVPTNPLYGYLGTSPLCYFHMFGALCRSNLRLAFGWVDILWDGWKYCKVSLGNLRGKGEGSQGRCGLEQVLVREG